MLRINLLPGKVSRRTETAKHELYAFVASLLVVLVVIWVWGASNEAEIKDLRQKIAQLNAEIEELKKEVAKVDKYKKEAEALEKKIDVISSLNKKKTGPAKLLNELAAILTEEKKVWLTKVSESGGSMKLEGGAMEYEKISEFQIALDRNSPFFSNVKLGPVITEKQNGVTFFRWSLTCKADYTAG